MHSADVGGWSPPMCVLYSSLIVTWGKRAECAGKQFAILCSSFADKLDFNYGWK